MLTTRDDAVRAPLTRPLVALAGIASAAGALAVAIWLVPASVQIVAWPSAGPDRVAYFAPVARLWWIVSRTAVVFVAAIAAVGRRRWGRAAQIVAPLQWLWLWTVPFWPVVPDRIPLLLIFSGPVRWVIAAAVLVCVGFRAGRIVFAGRSVNPDVETADRHQPNVRRARWSVFALSLALYVTAGLAWNNAVGFSGDEPHYLVIAHSLLVDHDLNIENNHARRDYAAFYAGTLKPDYLARGRHGEIYSVHAPGLAALLLPAYAVAGARGAVAFVALLAALAALAIFDTARMLAGPAAAWVTWAAVCLTVPFLPHAWLIYPETAALLVCAWAVRWLVAPVPDSVGRWVARGLAIGALPWLHTKYAILLAPLAVFVIGDAWRRGAASTRVRRAAAFAIPIGVVLVAWFVSFYVMYGVFDPEAPYGSFSAMFVGTSNIARGVFGLLIDQKFGLLVYAPVYLLTAMGLALIARDRERRLLTGTIVVTMIAFVASTARFYMWWGGASAPARFLVPVLPLAAPLIALAVGEWRRLAAITLAISLGIAVPAIARPASQILFSDAHGTSRVMTWLQGSAPLTSAWPTFTEPEWRSEITGAVRALAGRFAGPARSETAEHGRESLLLRYAGSRLRAFDYARSARADEAFVLSHAVLTRTRRDEQLNDDPARLAGPFDLAAGQYAVRVWFVGEPAPVSVHYHRSPAIATFAPGTSKDPTGASVTGDITLPVDAPVMWVGVADAAAAARVERVDIVPLAIVPRGERAGVDPIAIDPLGDRGLLVYADRNSYPEGGVFWTRGTRRAALYVAPGGATRLTAMLHLGPNGGTVNVRIGGTTHDAVVPPGGTVDLSVPIDATARLVPMTIEAPSSFVPARSDPRSDDTRQLGCQVRIVLN